jgi:hypothetical protein
MKTILYVGGALMVAASIYGFIDYNKSSRDKNFRGLYDNKKEISVRESREEANSAKETPVTTNEQAALTSKDEGPGSPDLKTNSMTVKKPVTKKKRRATLEKFSRAPLDEKYIKEEMKAESRKKHGKVVRKDPFGEKKEKS